MRELCELASDWRGIVPAGSTMYEQRVDGWRALRFPGIDDKVRLRTRSGHPIDGAGHILHRLALMEQLAGKPMVFNGEFQVGDTLEATEHWCERGWRLGGEAGTFHAFDCLTLAEWRAGSTERPLYERKAQLQALARAVDGRGCSPIVGMAPGQPWTRRERRCADPGRWMGRRRARRCGRGAAGLGSGGRGPHGEGRRITLLAYSQRMLAEGEA